MADKTIKVSLDFIANTSQAESALRNLQTSLANISNLSNLTPNQSISKELLEASDAAIVLRTSLQNAFDANTGKLDLSKFSTSLAGANTDVKKIGQSLMAIGPEGQAAFRDLTNAVLGSSTPLQQTNALVGKLWDSLKRTAGWQLSSTMIHGFMGAVQSAYGYAQNLNQSLNNIRIVTGQSTEQMAQFAEQANKAASSLSSTTLDYTDAALIYYQQGIRDESEIAERTDTTIKLANVSRQSAEEVSSQMTAIWNNFSDGSHTLEYYADVITKLGATTASSSQEIAGGMEKFAAVAETVGLSYEYAASALATVVATTRQSEDTVGTGLRTIFSRLEGLKLGDTLEDGTDLNKYSQALKTVGVNIKDASGELKDMDTILDETAAKWDMLDQAQKVAFATTVGGVRQYTNLIALLDNWDMMQENVTNALGSEGTLQEQQEIYAESWEAAEKRVRAAAEAIYSDLLSDDFFIGITKLFAGLLEHLDKFIDGIGGLGTLLPGLIILMNKMFGPQIQENIAKLSYNIAGMFTKVKNAREAQDAAMKNQIIAAYKDINMSNIQDKSSVEGQVLARSYERIAELQSELVTNGNTMTQQQKDIKNLEISRLESLMKINAEKGKSIDLARKEAMELAQQGMQGFSKNTRRIAGFKDTTKTWDTNEDETMTMQQKIASVSPTIAASLKTAMAEAQAVFGDSIVNMSMKVTEFHNLLRDALNISPQTQEMAEKFVSVADSIGYIEQKLNNFQTKAKESNIPINIKTDKQAENVIKSIEKELDQLKGKLKDGGDAGKLATGLTASLDKIKNKGEITEEEIQELIKQIQNLRTEANKELELKIDTTDLDEAQKKVAEEQNQNREQAEERGYQAGTERANVEDQPEVPEIPAPDISGYEQFAATLQNVANYAMQAQMAISGFNSALDAITDYFNGDATFGEALMKVLGGLATSLPLIITLVRSLGKSAITAGAEAATGGALAGGGGIAAAGGIKAIGVAIQTFLPWAALIFTALAAIIAIFKRLATETDTLEKQKKVTEDLATATQHAKDELQNLQNTISKFKSTENALENLTKGSEEFSEKLKENNELMLELINAADLIAGEDWYIDGAGVYHLTKKGEAKVDESQEEAEHNVAVAQAAQAMSQALETRIENQNNLKYGEANTNLGITRYDTQTLRDIDLALREQGAFTEDQIKSFSEYMVEKNYENFNALFKDQKNIQDGQIVDLINKINDSTLNTSTKDYLAQYGFDGQEESFMDVHETQEKAISSETVANSKVAAALGQVDPKIASRLNLSVEGLTDGIIDLIEEPLEEAKAELPTGDELKKQYAEYTGQAVEDIKDVKESEMQDALAIASLPQELLNAVYQKLTENIINSGMLDTALNTANIDIIPQNRGMFQEAALQVTDWSSEEQLQAFQETLSQLGMNIPLEQLKAFADALLQVGDAASTSNPLVEGQDKVYEAQANYDTIKEEGRQQGETGAEYAARLSEAAQELAKAKDDLDATLDTTLEGEAEKYDLDAGYLKDLGDAFQETNEKLAEGEGMLEATAEAAKDAAVRYARYNEAIEDIAKNYDDYVDVLKDAKNIETAEGKAALKNTDNFKKLQKSLAGLLDVSEDFIDADLVKAIDPKDFEKAAQGDEKAIERIRDSFIDVQAAAAGLADDPSLDAFKQKLHDLEDGAIIDLNNEPFLQKLLEAKIAAGAGVEEIEKLFRGMQIDTDGIELYPLTVDQATAAAAAIAAGNNDALVDALGVEVQPEEVTIVQNDSKEMTGTKITATPTPISWSLPSMAYTDTGGYEEGPRLTGQGYIDAYHVEPDKQTTNEEKQTSATAIVARNPHKSTGGMKAPTTSTKKGSGGGGGGGGGGSKKSKEAPKADRGTRYHAVTRRQSNVSRQQTENNRRKDRAFGKAQVELAREDLEIQKKKIELQEEYTKEISKNLKDDREEMKKQFEALQLPINFKFDEDGEIENYQEIIDALFEKEKALVEQYNSGGLDDEAFDEAKKKLDEAKEALGNYEETLELQKDELQTLEEYMEELADKALELTQIKFELNMSIIEDQLEWLDYSLSEIEDDAYSAAKAIALMGEQTSQYLKQGDLARAAILEILGRHGVNSIEELNGLSDSQIEALGFNKDEIDALKEYRSQLYESNQALLEMRRNLTDKVLDTFDTFNEKVQESYDQFDKYNDILETYNNIVDLLGTKTDAATRKLVKNIRDAQLQNLRNQSVSAKEIYEGAVANYELAKKHYEDAVQRYGVNSIEAQQAEEVMKTMQEAMDEGYSNWLNAYQSALEKAREIYEGEMDELQRDFERMVSGIYGTLGLFEAAYERAKELRENYVPEYEKIYELNKLNRDIQKEIDNSSSIRDRKALRQLQEEINRKQEAGVQLSKYEVEEMRKKFELEQARMRLEDARNNKSEVRLTRDGNGNWGYVYTAAEDEVADAEQKYEDALYNYQKLSDDYINDLDEKIKELTKNTQERLKEVEEALTEGLITEDEAQARREEILNGFYEQQDYLVSQFNISTNNLSNTIGLMYELYGREAELIDSFPETLFGEISEDGTIESWAETSKQGLLKYVDDIVKAYKTLQETNQKISDQNKLNLSDINTATQNITDKSTEAQKKVSDTVKEVSDSFTSTMQSLQDWDETYASIIKDAVDANKGFIDSLNQIIKQLAAISSYEMKDLYDQIDYMSAKVSRGEELTQADWDKLNEIKQRYADAYLQESAPFDTGGYTGEWGKEGKLAILHEKEYVLNADLTARFFDALKTFSLIDQFVNTENQMQQQKLQIQTLETLSHYIDQLADRMNTTTINPNDFSTSLLNSGNQQLEQNVHIEASFPNVTQSSEIEMAFDNLVNKASQYANRKNMSSMTFEDMYITKF